MHLMLNIFIYHIHSLSFFLFSCLGDPSFFCLISQLVPSLTFSSSLTGSSSPSLFCAASILTSSTFSSEVTISVENKCHLFTEFNLRPERWKWAMSHKWPHYNQWSCLYVVHMQHAASLIIRRVTNGCTGAGYAESPYMEMIWACVMLMTNCTCSPRIRIIQIYPDNKMRMVTKLYTFVVNQILSILLKAWV